jgi:hypothetical protein
MTWRLFCTALLALPAMAHAQEIVKLPPGSGSNVTRPDDLFALPPDQWHFARQLWQGSEPCTVDQCEAGFTSGDLVISVEHAGKFVRIIAGLRTCEATAHSEMEPGKKPGKSTRKRVAKQVGTVVKGLGKTCKVTMPAVAPLDVALLFPQPPTATPSKPAPPPEQTGPSPAL